MTRHSVSLALAAVCMSMLQAPAALAGGGLAVLGSGRTLGLRPEFHWLRERAHGRGRWRFDHRREDARTVTVLRVSRPTARATAPGRAQRWNTPNQPSMRAPSQLARPTSTYSTGVAPLSAAAKISG